MKRRSVVAHRWLALRWSMQDVFRRTRNRRVLLDVTPESGMESGKSFCQSFLSFPIMPLNKKATRTSSCFISQFRVNPLYSSRNPMVDLELGLISLPQICTAVPSSRTGRRQSKKTSTKEGQTAQRTDGFEASVIFFLLESTSSISLP